MYDLCIEPEVNERDNDTCERASERVNHGCNQMVCFLRSDSIHSYLVTLMICEKTACVLDVRDGETKLPDTPRSLFLHTS